MHRNRYISSKKQIIKILLVFVIPFIIFLIAYNFYTIKEINKRLAENGKNVIRIFSNSIQMDVDSLQRYTANIIANDSAFRQLVYSDKQYEQYAYMQEVVQKLCKTFNSNIGIAGYIIYEKNHSIFQEAYADAQIYSFSDKLQFKNILLDNTCREDMRQNWESVEMIGERGYLFYTFYEKNVYIMIIYDLEKTVYSQIAEDGKSDTYLFLTDKQKNPLTFINELEQSSITFQNITENDYVISGSTNKYLLIEESMENLPLNIIYAAPYYGLFSNGNIIPIVFIGISIGLMILMMRSFQLLEKKYIAPFQNLIDTMATIEEGNLETKLECTSNIQEFQVLSNSFNKMMDKIRKLKIASYQYRLEMQQAQLQYLQIQIRPHFFLNCLKNLYGLAEENKTEKIQKMILTLSKYLRCVMRDSFLLLPAQEEFENVKNYIALVRMTAAYPLSFDIDVDESLKTFKIPPLSVLTFVENSVKYANPTTKILKIHIKMSYWGSRDEKYVVITILDNGIGFSQENLKNLNNTNNKYVYHEKHIGIQNVKQRFSLLYKEKAMILFSNMTGSGANIQIFIPVTEGDETNDSHGH